MVTSERGVNSQTRLLHVRLRAGRLSEHGTLPASREPFSAKQKIDPFWYVYSIDSWRLAMLDSIGFRAVGAVVTLVSGGN